MQTARYARLRSTLPVRASRVITSIVRNVRSIESGTRRMNVHQASGSTPQPREPREPADLARNVRLAASVCDANATSVRFRARHDRALPLCSQSKRWGRCTWCQQAHIHRRRAFLFCARPR